jgi:hypothetical protein
MCVREQVAVDGRPGFVGILRSLPSSEEHILLRSDLTVSGATLASMELLGIDASVLAENIHSIHDWVENWEVSSKLRTLPATGIQISPLMP